MGLNENEKGPWKYLAYKLLTRRKWEDELNSE